MVVDDLHVVRVAVAPDEADPEPVVDADAMLAAPIAAQGFKPVPWKDRQIPQFVGRVQLAELPLRRACNALKPACRPPVEEALRFLGPERPDHRTKRYNVTRYMSSGIGAAWLTGCEVSYAKVLGWEAGIRTPTTWFRGAIPDVDDDGSRRFCRGCPQRPSGRARSRRVVSCAVCQDRIKIAVSHR